jgi:hypothetical protein
LGLLVLSITFAVKVEKSGSPGPLAATNTVLVFFRSN